MKIIKFISTIILATIIHVNMLYVISAESNISSWKKKLKSKNHVERRKAVEQLGHGSNEKAVKYIMPLLDDANSYVRSAAITALFRLQSADEAFQGPRADAHVIR